MDVFGGLLSFAMNGGGGLFKSVYTGGNQSKTFARPQLIVFLFAIVGNLGTTGLIVAGGGNTFPNFEPHDGLYLSERDFAQLSSDGYSLTIRNLSSINVCQWISFGT